MENIIVKKGNQKGASTVCIKIDNDLKKEWEKFCINNDINQAATLKNVLLEIMKEGA